MKTRLSSILLLNTLGLLVLLLFFWPFPTDHDFWFSIDSAIFHFFNRSLVKNCIYLWIVAFTNNRIFDICSLLVIVCTMFWYCRNTDNVRQQRIISISLIMLITAIILNRISQMLLPIKRFSPTLFFSDIYRVSNLVDLSTKDVSKNSFPGDHGIVLLTFSAFMLRYFGKKAFAISLIIVVICALPRIMIGAHWFTDIVVGSLSVVLIGLPWFLMTSLSDRLMDFLITVYPEVFNFIKRLIPRKND